LALETDSIDSIENRTPIEYWQPDWSVPDWRDGPGQLTPRGMNQLYEVGSS